MKTKLAALVTCNSTDLSRDHAVAVAAPVEVADTVAEMRKVMPACGTA
jgi:hypothetical protein